MNKYRQNKERIEFSTLQKPTAQQKTFFLKLKEKIRLNLNVIKKVFVVMNKQFKTITRLSFKKTCCGTFFTHSESFQLLVQTVYFAKAKIRQLYGTCSDEFQNKGMLKKCSDV